MRLKNKSVNQAPSIGNLPENLAKQITGGLTQKFMGAGMSQADALAAAQAKTAEVLSSPNVKDAMVKIKGKFDSSLGEAVGEYEDGKRLLATSLLTSLLVLAMLQPMIFASTLVSTGSTTRTQHHTTTVTRSSTVVLLSTTPVPSTTSTSALL